MRTFILIIIAAILNIFAAGLSASGMSEEKKTRIAQVACAEIKETRGMDGALRVRRVNEARELIGGEVFLEGDEEIVRSVRWGECELLILDFWAYQTTVNEYERIAAEKRAEEERIAAEKRAEDRKRYESYANNILNSKSAEEMKGHCEDYIGKKDGLNRSGSNLDITVSSEVGFDCYVYKDGKREGFKRKWHENGQLREERNYVNGELEGLWREWDENGQLRSESNYVNGKLEGLWREWDENGQLRRESCYSKNGTVDMSNCR
jgi:hypothetical protein